MTYTETTPSTEPPHVPLRDINTDSSTIDAYLVDRDKIIIITSSILAILIIATVVALILRKYY